MCFWAAGLSVFVQHFGQQVWIEESMGWGNPGTHRLRSLRGGGGRPFHCIAFSFSSVPLGFWYLGRIALLTLIAPFLVRFSRPRRYLLFVCFYICLFSPFLAVDTRATSTSI
ncbi:hypothetical protein LZ30DRAFT_300014 [Colletotrichum cereale]|nr:hypothetical protein LZ30DRAFT_300014 [Colletotrichum cereale]